MNKNNRELENIPKVLVVGQAGKELTPKLREASENIGKAIAICNFNLITADFSGVDYSVANSYANSCRNLKKEFNVELYLERERPTRFTGGKTIIVKSALEAIVKAADLIIILNGSLGVKKIADYALSLKKPTLAFGSTGPVAQEVFNSIISNWENNKLQGIDFRKYKSEISYMPDPIKLALILYQIHFNKSSVDEYTKAKMTQEFQELSLREKPSSLSDEKTNGLINDIWPFLLIFIIIITSIAIISKWINPLMLSLVLIATIVFFILIVIFVFKYRKQISDTTFKEIVILLIKQIPLLKSIGRQNEK